MSHRRRVVVQRGYRVRRASVRRTWAGAAGLGLIVLCGRAQGQDRNWTNLAGGNWLTASNWSPADVPDTGAENALIDTAGVYTVTLASSLSINNLETRALGSRLDITGATLTVGGTFNARDNRIQGNRATSTLDVTGASTFDSTAGTPIMIGIVFVPRGIIDFRHTVPIDFCDTRIDHRNACTWTGAGNITMGLGTQWDMAAGATFDIQNSQSISYNSLGAVPTFNNAGTIRKSAGGGTTAINGLVLTNTGTIGVDTGTLSTDSVTLVSNTLAAGTWQVQGTGTLALVGQSVQTNNATVILDGVGSTFSAFDSLATNGATGAVTFSTGHTFTSAAGVTNNGQISVTSGSQFTSTGAFVNAGTTTLDNGQFSTAAALSNSGTLDVKNGAALTLQPGGTLTNLVGTTLTGGTYNVNAATITLQTGSVSTLNANVSLTGATADIKTAGGASSALAPLATIGATGKFSIKSTGTFNTVGNFTVATGGELVVDTGSTFAVAPGSAITNFAGGTFTGGKFTVRGTVIADGLAITTLASNFTLDSTTGQLINRTTGLSAFASLATIDTNGNFGVTGGSTFTTAGSLAMNASSVLTLGAAAGTTFTVSGNLNAAAASTIALTTGGSLAVTGNLNLAGKLTGSGTINGRVVNDGVISAGNSPGQLDITGDLLINSAGGFLFELGGLGAGTGYDQVNVNGLVTFDADHAGVATIAVLPSWFNFADIGQRYTLLTGTHLRGTFLDIAGLSGAGYELRPWQTDTAFGVEVVVPAPGVGAAVLGSLVLARRRRR